MKSFKNKSHEVAYNMMEISVELIDEVFSKVDKLAKKNSHRERNGLKLIDSGHFRWDIRQLKLNTRDKLESIMALLEAYGDDTKLVVHKKEKDEE
jgi:hypothetical protein|tara:strand:- start:163 stop:447 length:285 start_codon:yes stop_codon:yes gene_type:complete